MRRIFRGGPRTVPGIFKLAALSGLVLSLSSVARPAQADTPLACDPSDPHQVRLQISVSGMRSTDGNITITIYPDEPSHFLDGKYKLARQQVPVTLPITQGCFAFAAPGYYAVALFHDEHNSGHLETNMLGIPTEGYGFSRNPTLYVGPPDLSQVRFEAHAGDNPIAVQLKF